MKGIPHTYQDPAVPLIALPTTFTSRRLNISSTIEDNGSTEVANIKGPGCIRHIWFLRGGDLTLEITVDGAKEPQVLCPINSFFGIMQGRDPYYVNCAAYTVLPNWVAREKDPRIPGVPGYNLFLPIPFNESCRISVHGPKDAILGTMIDWHEYEENTELTPYRFHAKHKRNETTPARGLHEMVDTSGSGFLAGFLTGYIQKNHEDMVFHTGGVTILLDGETKPNAIRGCNVEDDYGFTWGFNDFQAHWIGCPQHDNRGRTDQDGVFYRFFGPDPIAFRSSCSFLANCRGDDMETVVYYYKIHGSSAPEIETPLEWQVTGPFPGADNFDTFQKAEFVEQRAPGAWPDELKNEDDNFKVSKLLSRHGWIDIQHLFYNVKDHSAYARTTIESEEDREAVLRISINNFCSIWINGEHIQTLRHEQGLETTSLSVKLQKGDNHLLLKTSNSSITPNRFLWVVNCVLE